jgi:hypothetical protein
MAAKQPRASSPAGESEERGEALAPTAGCLESLGPEALALAEARWQGQARLRLQRFCLAEQEWVLGLLHSAAQAHPAEVAEPSGALWRRRMLWVQARGLPELRDALHEALPGAEAEGLFLRIGRAVSAFGPTHAAGRERGGASPEPVPARMTQEAFCGMVQAQLAEPEDARAPPVKALFAALLTGPAPQLRRSDRSTLMADWRRAAGGRDPLSAARSLADPGDGAPCLRSPALAWDADFFNPFALQDFDVGAARAACPPPVPPREWAAARARVAAAARLLPDRPAQPAPARQSKRPRGAGSARSSSERQSDNQP